MGYSFRAMADRVRGDPLGHVGLNTLRTNLLALADLQMAQHAPDGTHNSLEVARTFGKMSQVAGSYVANNFGTHFTSVATPATGTATLTLPSGKYVVPGMVPLVTVSGESCLNKPCLATVEVVSATSVKVHVKVLSSALGAGNTWAANTEGFDIAIHTMPYAAGKLSLQSNPSWLRRDFLTEEATTWNALVANEASLYSLLRVEHLANGVHHAEEIAREYGTCAWDSALVKYVSSGTVASATRSSAGIIDVALSGTYTSTTTLMAMAEALSDTEADIVVAHARATSATNMRIYLYGYSGGVWSRVDCSFALAIYGT